MEWGDHGIVCRGRDADGIRTLLPRSIIALAPPLASHLEAESVEADALALC